MGEGAGEAPWCIGSGNTYLARARLRKPSQRLFCAVLSCRLQVRRVSASACVAASGTFAGPGRSAAQEPPPDWGSLHISPTCARLGRRLRCSIVDGDFGARFSCRCLAGGLERAVGKRDGWFGILTCLRFAACPGYLVLVYLAVLMCSFAIVTEV